MDLESFELNDMTDADLDREQMEELRKLAAENIVFKAEKHLSDYTLVMTQDHRVGTHDEDPEENFSQQEHMAMAAISHLTGFFHVRPQDVPNTFKTPSQIKEDERLRPQSPDGGIVASNNAIDTMKQSLERFQECPDCGEWCAIAKLEKRELQEEDKEVPFSCDSCGNEFTLEEVKE